MYLNLLSENEKKSFLVLAKKVAEADGLEEEEIRILNQYRQEMALGTDDDFDLELEKESIDNLLSNFTSRQSRKIVMLEIFALVYADGVYSDYEIEMLEHISEYFGFSEAEVNLCQDWSKAIVALSDQGIQIINL